MAPKRIILFEGTDDEHVIRHLCGNLNGPILDEFRKAESVENLLESISVRLMAAREGDIIGIVIDADVNLASRWQSIQDRLTALGYLNVPDNPDPAGTIIDPPDIPGKVLPRVGIWLMPDNQTDGILEDFLKYLVPDPSPLFDHVKTSVDNIPVNEKRFSDLAKPKVLIHTWLAWQEKPGCPYGTAISAKFLDPDMPEADIFVEWLNRLYYPTS